MKTWITADTHFGHLNMTEAGRDLCGRGFADVPEMNAALLDGINSCVGIDERLVILGDVAMGKLEDTLPWLSGIQAAEIILVPGNHDRWSPAYHTKGKTPEDKRARREEERLRYEIDPRIKALHGEDALWLEDGTVEYEPMRHWEWCQLSDEWMDHPLSDIAFSHFPAYGESVEGRPDRYTELRPNVEGPVIHGHVHTAWRTNANHFNVGVDVNDFKPVHEDELVAWVESL